jgi:di/tricarboxylate transporter
MKTNAVPSRPTGKQVRTQQRAAHLVAGLLVLVAVYAGPLLGPVFAAAVQWVAFPALVLTGVAMWKWPRIRRALRGRATAPAR